MSALELQHGRQVSHEFLLLRIEVGLMVSVRALEHDFCGSRVQGNSISAADHLEVAGWMEPADSGQRGGLRNT